MDHSMLKEKQRALRQLEPYSSNRSLQFRVHRALSWLEACESTSDLDSRFLFLWIAFNAAYAAQIDGAEGFSEQRAFRGFLREIVALDRTGRIEDMVWNEFGDSIRTLLQSRYIFADFWLFHAGRISEAEWLHAFEKSHRKVRDALRARATERVLAIVLSRVYVLRNQIMHGGATWDSQVNREQLRVCVNFLGKLMPVVIDLLMTNPQVQWPPVSYPVVEEPVLHGPRRSKRPTATPPSRGKGRSSGRVGGKRGRSRNPPPQSG